MEVVVNNTNDRIIVVIDRGVTPPLTLKFFIGSGAVPQNYIQKPLSTTVQDNNLKGVNIVGWLLLDNIPIDIDDVGIGFNSTIGTLDFSSLGDAYNGRKIIVVVSKKYN